MVKLSDCDLGREREVSQRLKTLRELGKKMWKKKILFPNKPRNCRAALSALIFCGESGKNDAL